MNRRISLKDIVFSYKNTKVIDIKAADFYRKKVTAVTGPNGSGKTTLLKIISGILVPDKGDIYLDEVRIINGMRRILMANSTFVHQTPYIFTGTVKKNILMGLGSSGLSRRKMEEMADQLLSSFDLEKYKYSKARGLSGGERQKIALARAAGMDRDFLILDEPLAHIDSKSKVKIENMLEKLAEKGKTLIFATHDQDLASRLADSIIQLENGRITRS